MNESGIQKRLKLGRKFDYKGAWCPCLFNQKHLYQTFLLQCKLS